MHLVQGKDIIESKNKQYGIINNLLPGLISKKKNTKNGGQGKKIQDANHNNTDKKSRNHEKLKESIISTIRFMSGRDKLGI